MRYHQFFGIVIAILVTSLSYSDISVIVNPSNTAASMTKSEVKKLFLGITSAFPEGGVASPVDLPESSTVRTHFYQFIANKSAAKMNAYWSQMVFSGEAVPPEAVTDGASVRSLVASNPDGIGYIDTSQVDGSVKVVLTIK